MLREKYRRALKCVAVLERGTLFFQAVQGGEKQRLPDKNAGRNAMRRRNESFSVKNGRKQGFCRAKFFAIAFAARLVYGIMVACAG